MKKYIAIYVIDSKEYLEEFDTIDEWENRLAEIGDDLDDTPSVFEKDVIDLIKSDI